MSTNPFNTLTSPVRINEIVENVLLITLNPENPKNLFLMSDDTNGTNLWTLESIEMNLFERLMTLSCEEGDDNKVILYLFKSYVRLHRERESENCEVTVLLSSLIFRNVSTALKEPELFASQDFSAQWLDIFKDMEYDEKMLRDQFLSLATKLALEDCDSDMRKNVTEIFFKCFDECLKSVRQASMITLEQWILEFLIAFSCDKENPAMANLFLQYILLPTGSDGIKYAETLLGKLLCLVICLMIQ